MRAEIAVGKQGGTWSSIWVDVPVGGKHPNLMSENELMDLCPDLPYDTSFIHLMYVEQEGHCSQCGGDMKTRMDEGAGKTLQEVEYCPECES